MGNEPRFDLSAAGFRIERGRTPATTQLAEQIKALILKQQLPPGTRLPTATSTASTEPSARTSIRLGNLADLDPDAGEIPEIRTTSQPPQQPKSKGKRPRNNVFDDRGSQKAADG
ncbi:hypothetical protein [Streptomyces rapamycinicus]|uniref:GntR family transcriptional regulator n=2 Tax=Streptomyces rapamycinicus TaxID=1226757 RepID=A0A3L8RFD3_STRRN|nr:hypothetical protein [Streptomyces rapamycinicus]MBB4786925.1 hypothetical protein [Streptomyces rapamycinicus]RLV77622.1 GntR family transcriptional regulator [Streptomyces rapamycinicus NRRL 5491]UTO66943.1 hypothetical protein LJB45_34590 [Streptomyces rapamycinicus]UTP34899.1 hypothetical protein LIV37_39720 [Streptomyces rapamycinicus NRRL 5491]